VTSGLVAGLNAAILAVTKGQPRVLTVEVSPDSPDQGWEGPAEGTAGARRLPALPFGPLDPAGDLTLELALRRWVRTQTGLELGYVEQLYSFGDRFRDPREASGGARVVSIAYLALIREERIPGRINARWRDIYEFFPWEDHREGPRLEAVIEALRAWAGDDQARALRAQIAFGYDGAPWDSDRVLERYELLYEVGLVAEKTGGSESLLGQEMGLDHRRILATALGRLRGKIRYRPVVFELLPDEFTLLQLQQTVEALAGLPLHKQNVRRLVEQAGLVEGTGRVSQARGRPAELFRFRHDVLRERPAPGVGLPRS
jgi:hypothetical protein